MGGSNTLLDHMYLALDIGKILISGCEVNLYALTLQVSFKWRKLSTHEYSVNVKSACVVDIIDIFCSFD